MYAIYRKPVTVKDFAKAAAIFVSAALMMAVMSGCGKSGGGGSSNTNQIPPGTVINNCATCGANSQILASGMGQSIYGGQTESVWQIQFFGTGNNMTNMQVGTPYLQNTSSYYGSVAAQGTITWNIASLLCGIPAGTYNVTTVNPGTWQAQSFDSISLQATGPTTLQIVMSGSIVPTTPAIVGPSGQQFPFRIVGWMSVRGTANTIGLGMGGGSTCPIGLY